MIKFQQINDTNLTKVFNTDICQLLYIISDMQHIIFYITIIILFVLKFIAEKKKSIN